MLQFDMYCTMYKIVFMLKPQQERRAARRNASAFQLAPKTLQWAFLLTEVEGTPKTLKGQVGPEAHAPRPRPATPPPGPQPFRHSRASSPSWLRPPVPALLPRLSETPGTEGETGAARGGWRERGAVHDGRGAKAVCT